MIKSDSNNKSKAVLEKTKKFPAPRGRYRKWRPWKKRPNYKKRWHFKQTKPAFPVDRFTILTRKKQKKIFNNSKNKYQISKAQAKHFLEKKRQRAAYKLASLGLKKKRPRKQAVSFPARKTLKLTRRAVLQALKKLLTNQKLNLVKKSNKKTILKPTIKKAKKGFIIKSISLTPGIKKYLIKVLTKLLWYNPPQKKRFAASRQRLQKGRTRLFQKKIKTNANKKHNYVKSISYVGLNMTQAYARHSYSGDRIDRKIKKQKQILSSLSKRGRDPRPQKLIADCQELDQSITLMLLLSRAVRRKKHLKGWVRFWSKYSKEGNKLLAQISSHICLVKQSALVTSELFFSDKERLSSFLFNFAAKKYELYSELLVFSLIKAKKRIHHPDLVLLQKLEGKGVVWKRSLGLKRLNQRRVTKVRKKLKGWLKHIKKWKGKKKQQLRFKAAKAKQRLKATRSVVLKRIADRGVVRTKKQKFRRKSAFINYYRYVDGVYNSYWFGKFTNMFIKEGKKRRALSIIHVVFNSLKFTYNSSIFKILIGTLNRLRSVFKLRKYKVRKGREIKEYPVLTRITLLYIHVLIKIKKRIIRSHYPVEKIALNKKKNRGLRIYYIRDTIKRNLAEQIINPRKHVFVRERRVEVKNSVRFMINRRFNKKKRH